MATEELVQVVDNEDNPLRGATRKEIHTQGLYHRIARIVVEDGQGNTLLQKRSPTVSVFPNCWDNAAAGHVDVDETYEAAAQRELKEELGIVAHLEKVAYYKKETVIGEKILNRFITIYRTVVSKDTPLILQEAEVSEVRWFTIKELKELVANKPDEAADGLFDTIKLIYSQ